MSKEKTIRRMPRKNPETKPEKPGIIDTLSEGELSVVREYYCRFQLAEASMKAEMTRFEYETSKVLIEKSLPPKQVAFCMICGAIHLAQKPVCHCEV